MGNTKTEVLLDIKLYKYLKKNPSYLEDSFYIKQYNLSKSNLIKIIDSVFYIDDFIKSSNVVDVVIDIILSDEEYENEKNEIEQILVKMKTGVQ